MNRKAALPRLAFADSNGQVSVVTIAFIRLGFSLLLVLGSMGDVDDPQFGWHAEFDDFLASVYVFVALTAFGLAWRAPFRDFLFFPSVVAFDIAIMVAIMTTIERPQSGFLGALVTGIAFVLFETANRWDFAAAYRISKFFILTTAIQLAMLVVELHPQLVGGEVLIRRLVILLIVVSGTLWAVGNMRRVFAPPWTVELGRQFDDLKHDALVYAAKAIGAQAGTLCWTVPGDKCCEAPIITIDEDPLASQPRSRACSAPRSEADYSAALVDLPTKQALVLGKSDSLHYQDLSGIDTTGLKELGISSALIVRLFGESGSGKLILSDIPTLGWHQLRVGAAVGKEVVRGLDQAAFRITSLDLEALRIKQAIARDLHDSVAQSLAGARYWIRSVKSASQDADIKNELSGIDRALEEEQKQLRAMIETLRGEGAPLTSDSAKVELRSLCLQLSQLWQVDIVVNTIGFELPLTARDTLELMQMIREGVSNAVRHGRADKVRIDIDGDTADWVQLRIMDNGTGFHEGEASAQTSLGERALAFGGSVAHTRVDGWTHVNISIPIRS